MLGDAVFNLPSGYLQDKHMQAARLVLQQYDVLLLLSAPPGEMQLGFNFGLAWQVGTTFNRGTLGRQSNSSLLFHYSENSEV